MIGAEEIGSLVGAETAQTTLWTTNETKPLESKRCHLGPNLLVHAPRGLYIRFFAFTPEGSRPRYGE